MRAYLSLFSGAGQGEGNPVAGDASSRHPEVSRFGLQIWYVFVWKVTNGHYCKAETQRPWVFLATGVGIAAVMAFARVFSPGEPPPLTYSLLYGLLAMAIAMVIIQTAYV